MKRNDIHKVLIIGSGPIIIGQACEFDYSGTQACKALKQLGYEIVLVNSNPATIMTDPETADVTYIEPLNVERLSQIIEKERPDALLPNLGGQSGLNLCSELAEAGVLDKYNVKVIGVQVDAIERGEDRIEFKHTMESLGIEMARSQVAYTVDEALEIADELGYPVVLRPAYTMGGAGGGLVYNKEELKTVCARGLQASMVGQVLVEESILGWEELELEVVRDAKNQMITICFIENIDPLGVHTGDSFCSAPMLTIPEHVQKRLQEKSYKIVESVQVIGGTNVQWAHDPKTDRDIIIEINPRTSRSSALASKATGFPIALVSAMLASGLTLDEIPCGKYGTLDKYVPGGDYIVIKFARWAFEKFKGAKDQLGTQMRAVGEVMSIGKTYKEAFQKAIRSLEIGRYGLGGAKDFGEKTKDELLKMLITPSSERQFIMYEALRKGATIEELYELTKIKHWFIEQMKELVDEEEMLKNYKGSIPGAGILNTAKLDGFSDKYLAKILEVSEDEIREAREKAGIVEAWEGVHVSGTKDAAYYYSSYHIEDKSPSSTDRQKIMILGGGPNRIGQGIEFDYSTVHAVKTIKEAGYEAIIINNNPETVSTDYTTSDKLYFEPLCVEDVMNVIEMEKPDGIIASLGGQTAINLANPLQERGVRLIGTDCVAIEKAENRDSFEKLLAELKIPQPKGKAVTNIEDGVKAAEEIGYPVLVRPSFVLGGRAMQIVAKEEHLRHYLKTAVEIDEDKPVLVDKYICGKEVEIDAICDGTDVFVPGIMELVERTGVHSGDSISVYPTFSISDKIKATILDYAKKLGIGIGIVGLFNIQFIVDRQENVSIIEVNPRSSRTVPFLSKATGYPLADIATKVILGNSLKEQGITVSYPEEKKRWYVKVPAFSFAKLNGMDAYLSPEMKSTGEAIGYDKKLHRAMYKAMIASGMRVQNYGTVIVTLADEDKVEALPLIRRFYDMGFNIEATSFTGEYLKQYGIRTRILRKPSEGSSEILDAIRAGYVSYVINTRAILSGVHYEDGVAIRNAATQNNITMLTSLDTVKVLLDVLEEVTIGVSTIDAE